MWSRLSYAGVLLFVLVGCTWLEVVVRTRVLRRWRRLLLALVPGLVVFAAWDAYAIATGHWYFDELRILGWRPVADVPIDELAFFVVIPYAAILTFEAVRAVKGWPAGDEAA